MNSATSSQDTVDALGKFIFNCIFVRTGRQDNINTEVWIGTGVPRRAYHKEVAGKRTQSITVQFEHRRQVSRRAAQATTLSTNISPLLFSLAQMLKVFHATVSTHPVLFFLSILVSNTLQLRDCL